MRPEARRTTHRTRARASAIVIAFFLGSVGWDPTAAAEEACSGLGPAFQMLDPGDDESGIGGTGVQPSRALPHSGDEESGVGGTGIRPSEPRNSGDESGIGGTGLFGTVEKIESDPNGRMGGRICIGGAQVGIPETLALESSVDGGSATALAEGQLAFVQAVQGESGLVAQQVVIVDGGAGQIEVLSGNGMLIVSGQRLRLSESGVQNAGARLEAGAWIVYHGQKGLDDVVRVTRIEPAPRGTVRSAEPNLEERLARWLRREGIDYVSLEGVASGGPSRPRVGGLEIRLPGSPRDTQSFAWTSGARVRVGGRLDQGGKLRLEPPPAWLARPDRPRPPLERPTVDEPRPPSSPEPSILERPMPQPRIEPPKKPHRPDPVRPRIPPRVRDAKPALPSVDVHRAR